MVQILQAGSEFPRVKVPKLTGGVIELSQTSEGYDWKMVVVYRGVHCPLCTRYLKELDAALPEFQALGVELVALSADSKERATRHIAEAAARFDIGYDLTIPQMRELGLYISGPQNGMDVERPFAEPGLFVINEQNTLQIIDVSNVPFARPSVASMLMGLKYLRGMQGKFPINGTHA